MDMRRPLATAGTSGRPYGSLLAALALTACWLVTALTYALLTQPTSTLTTLDMRGARGVPAVIWAGSRDLVRLFQPAVGSVTHD
jgi:hypothetical protein